MLSFSIVYAGSFDGVTFERPEHFNKVFYRELTPISEEYEQEALDVNGLDRELLKVRGTDPAVALTEAYYWVKNISQDRTPVLVAYPLSFDWTWLYWYFVRFSKERSPFKYSSCFDIKTAYAVKAKLPVAAASRKSVASQLASTRQNTHNAVDDAVAQAELFANIFEWNV